MADSLVVVFNKLPQLSVALHGVLAEHVKEIATAIMQTAQSNAPVDTGFLQSALYVVTKDTSTYGQGVVPGKGDSYLLPEVAAPDNDQTAIVAAGANYSLFVEMGTSRMAAAPFLLPAVESLASTFNSGGDIEQKLAALVGAP